VPVIRRECPADYEQIDYLLTQAFGGTDEVVLVERLRSSEEHIPELSLVMVEDGQIIAHIMFSPLQAEQAPDSTRLLSLAPLSVRPKFQRSGYGGVLVRFALEECSRLGYTAVVVIGHPAYYPRFGFSPAKAWDLREPFGCPEDVFMALELTPGSLEGVSGMFQFGPAFDPFR